MTSRWHVRGRITWLVQNSGRCRKQYARYAGTNHDGLVGSLHQRSRDHLVRIYAKLRETTREAGVPVLPDSLLGYSSPITARRQYSSTDHVACDRQEGSGKLAIQLQIWRRSVFFCKMGSLELTALILGRLAWRLLPWHWMAPWGAWGAPGAPRWERPVKNMT